MSICGSSGCPPTCQASSVRAEVGGRLAAMGRGLQRRSDRPLSRRAEESRPGLRASAGSAPRTSSWPVSNSWYRRATFSRAADETRSARSPQSTTSVASQSSAHAQRDQRRLALDPRLRDRDRVLVRLRAPPPIGGTATTRPASSSRSSPARSRYSRRSGRSPAAYRPTYSSKGGHDAISHRSESRVACVCPRCRAWSTAFALHPELLRRSPRSRADRGSAAPSPAASFLGELVEQAETASRSSSSP